MSSKASSGPSVICACGLVVQTVQEVQSSSTMTELSKLTEKCSKHRLKRLVNRIAEKYTARKVQAELQLSLSRCPEKRFHLLISGGPTNQGNAELSRLALCICTCTKKGEYTDKCTLITFSKYSAKSTT